MSLQLPFGIQPTNAVPVDFFYGPYADVPTAISSVPEAVRYEGQTVYILGDGEYRWVGGTGDGDLVASGGGDSIFTGGTFSGPSALLGAGQNLEIGTAASRLSRVDIRTDGASTVISDLTGGVFESQITVQGFGTTLNSSNLGINQISTLFSSGALGESTMRVRNAALQQTKISTLISGGIVFTNDIGNTWAKYDQDYSPLGLLDDLSIPDVGGVKTLISSEGFYGNDGDLVDNRTVNGLGNFLSFTNLSTFHTGIINSSGFNGSTFDYTIDSGSNLSSVATGTGLTNNNKRGRLDVYVGGAALTVIPDITNLSAQYGFGADESFGMIIFDSVDFKGLQRNSGDGANLTWGVDNDYYVTMGDVITNVGGGGGDTNLTWNASTREVESDTGTNATISIFDGTNAGLTPSSNGLATEYLKGDGTWGAIVAAETIFTGGTMTQNSTIDGSYILTINPGGGQAKYTMNDRGLTCVSTAVRLTAASTQIRLSTGGSIDIEDPTGLIGMIGQADYSALASLDDNAYAQYGWIQNHIGLQDINALVTNPTATEDGYFIAWNEGNGEYELIAAAGGGGVNPGTDNYIPIYNALGDNIEDSTLRTSVLGNDTRLIWSSPNPSDTVFKIEGDTGDADQLNFFMGVNPHPTNAFPEYTTVLDTHGVSYEQKRNRNTGTITNEGHSFRMPQSNSAKVDLYNFGGVDTNTPRLWHTTYGGVDYMGHKFGTGADPRDLINNTDNYTWVSDNNQHFCIGALTNGNTNNAGALNAQNAHLVINSLSTSTNPEPHLRFKGTYNVSAGTPSNNTLWLDSSDSKIRLKGSVGQDIILEDLIDTPSDELVTYKFTKGGAITTANVVSPGEFNTPMGVSVPFDVEVVDVSVQVGLATVSISGNMPIDIRTLASTSAGVGFPLTSGVGSSLHSFNCNHVAGTTYHRVYTSNGISSSTVTQGNILFVAIGTTTYTATTMDDIVVTVTCKKV